MVINFRCDPGPKNPLKLVRCHTTSDYEALILTPQQAFAVLMDLPEPERTLTLLVAATGLRISEALGLQWAEVSFERSRIEVRRAWVGSRLGEPKSKASKAPVPLCPFWLSSCSAGNRRRLTPRTVIGSSRALERRVRRHGSEAC